MRRSVFITVTGTLATVLGALIIAQSDSGRAAKPPPVPLLYNPYPPGILPADLLSEIARVRLDRSLPAASLVRTSQQRQR